MMRKGIALGLARIAAGPVRIGAANRSRRTRIGIETQMYQRRCAPSCPVAQAGGRPPVTAEPGPRGAREGSAVIARTGDHRNRHAAGNRAPAAPAVKLGKIVAAHQPDETMLRKPPDKLAQGINGVAGAQLALDRCRHDWRSTSLTARRSESGRKRRHTDPGLQGIARRNQPPHRIEPKRLGGEQRDPAMPAVRGIEAPAKEPDPAQGRTCPVPRTSHL